MDNSQIADYFSLLAKLMDIHGENSFKAKSYAAAAFAIDKLPLALSETPHEKFFSIKGIGESSGKKIIELLQTGSIKALSDLISKTPEGILEMLSIKGLGPKKIATIWKEMEIETIGELLYACQENRLKLYKGFGEKTQQSVMEAIEFYQRNKGSFLYVQMEEAAPHLKAFFEKLFPSAKVDFTGAYKRQLEVIDELELVISNTFENITQTLKAPEFILEETTSESSLFKSASGIRIRIYPCAETDFIKTAFLKGCSEEFAKAFPDLDYGICKDEADLFTKAGLAFIPAAIRENASAVEAARNNHIPALISTNDIRGIIHSHSDWSDGSNTIEQMAKAAIGKGYEYLVISDHSKSAFYASGLSEERIKAQHQYINELNSKLAPFRIFKSIESDILNDGSLDYSDSVLSSFDLVIASVHSNLKMTEEKAMMRLMTAIENPYTSILGHMTGRLLLSRKGYPVDHKKIIDACAANNVVIELNAHPSRLDIDWRHIHYALEKGVLISIDPDAHSTEGFEDVKYGVLTAQKAMVTSKQNLSSFTLNAFEEFITKQRSRRQL